MQTGVPTNAGSLIHLSNYTDRLKELRDAGAPDKQVRIFVASDDPSAEDEVAGSFPEGSCPPCNSALVLFALHTFPLLRPGTQLCGALMPGCHCASASRGLTRILLPAEGLAVCCTASYVRLDVISKVGYQLA